MKHYLLIILIIICFIPLLGAFFIWEGIYLPKDANSQEEKIFIIERGEGTREIALNLEKEGLIKSGPLFQLYTLWKGVSGNLQAGNYLLSPSMTIPEITKNLVSGEVIRIKITIPEGFNLAEVIQELLESYPNSYRIKELKVNSFQEDFEFLKDAPPEANLEGFLFPDTYYFKKQETENKKQKIEEIVQKMLTNFDKKLTPDLKTEINRQNKTIFEIVIMASLIEKEVKTFEDKKLVSGILWKRLEAGIPLQVDATITYITGKKTTKILKTELQIDSPYNTYKYKGLPLGPISNPGLESILAAVYPEDSDYWYYLSTPEGETIFSKALEEHNIAKAKYLK